MKFFIFKEFYALKLSIVIGRGDLPKKSLTPNTEYLIGSSNWNIHSFIGEYIKNFVRNKINGLQYEKLKNTQNYRFIFTLKY